MNQEQITALLRQIVHPETGTDIVTSGIAEGIELTPDGIHIKLSFPKSRDPFAGSIRRQIMQRLSESDPSLDGKVNVSIREAAPKPKESPIQTSSTDTVGRIVAVSSGKGGVGKSTVAANLAVALHRAGYRVGVLDADIYGPSMPRMFGVEGYVPSPADNDKRELIIPAEAYGVKIMSIGFFINPDDALVWRGPMATSALKQLMHQTDWGELDFLIVDLPPGTGDVHLTLLQELKVSGAIIVSTPQQIALADVARGIRMFRTPQIGVPILGIIENMAWFTPAELPHNRYYLFGQGGAAKMAEEEGIPVLGQIPIVQSIMEGADAGRPVASGDSETGKIYLEIAQKIAHS